MTAAAAIETPYPSRRPGGGDGSSPWGPSFTHFPPFRLFDETVPSVEMVFYELEPIELTGRRTVD